MLNSNSPNNYNNPNNPNDPNNPNIPNPNNSPEVEVKEYEERADGMPQLVSGSLPAAYLNRSPMVKVGDFAIILHDAKDGDWMADHPFWVVRGEILCAFYMWLSHFVLLLLGDTHLLTSSFYIRFFLNSVSPDEHEALFAVLWGSVSRIVQTPAPTKFKQSMD
jgi:hypothetical protein